MPERIVVVGHAAVTCLGRDMDATWNGLIEGRSGLRRHIEFPSQTYLQDIVGCVDDFGPGSSSEDPAIAKLAVRSIHLAMAAARAAWSDSGLDDLPFDRKRAAVIVGSAFGGQDLLQSEQVRASHRSNLATSPYLVPGLINNQSAGQIAQHLGLYGPSAAPANACASGGHSIAIASILLRAGEADLALCGGCESAFTPAIMNSLATMKALLPRKSTDRSFDDPTQSSRPFSIDRAGFVLSEGAGMLALATETTARRLGLEIQAEVAGWAMNTDGFHVAMSCRDRIAECLSLALGRASLDPSDVDYYNAHGTSTIANDKVETEAIKQVFKTHANQMPVSSIKGALGHSLGAAAAIEAAVCVRALREQLIPPTLNYEPDPDLDLDYVPNQARDADLSTIVSASFGFGGTNNALVFRRWSS